jgi:hypothetical protein
MILPIKLDSSKKLKIAVLGDAAHDKIITGGGGSGSVISEDKISPLDGIISLV